MTDIKWYLYRSGESDALGQFTDLGNESASIRNLVRKREGPSPFPTVETLQEWLAKQGYRIFAILASGAMMMARDETGEFFVLVFDVLETVYIIETHSIFLAADVLNRIRPLLELQSAGDAADAAPTPFLFEFGRKPKTR